MEVSINSMMAADTVVITMITRAKPCTGPDILIYFYFDINTQAGLQDIFIVGSVDQLNFHRNSLCHLYKVSGRIVGGKQGKLCAGSQTESRNLSEDVHIRVTVQFHLYILAFPHFCKLRFFEVDNNPKLIVVHHSKERLAGLHILPYFQIKFANTPIARRVQMAIRKAELR